MRGFMWWQSRSIDGYTVTHMLNLCNCSGHAQWGYTLAVLYEDSSWATFSGLILEDLPNLD